MLTKELMQHIENNALAGRTVNGTESTLVLVPDNCGLKNLEQYNEYRDRFRGCFKTTRPYAFCDYVKIHAGNAAVGFVSDTGMTAKVIFDFGTPIQPGHCQDTAVIQLGTTAAYYGLTDILRDKHTQRSLIDWLEDWEDHIFVLDQFDAAMPTPQAIASIRSMTIKSASSVTTKVGDFSASRSAMDDIEARSAGQMPAKILFKACLYDDLLEQEITLRVSVLTGGDDPMFKLRWVGEAVDRDNMANEFRRLLADQMEEIELHVGQFD